MVQAGTILGIIGAALVVVDVVYRVTKMTNVIDGGTATTTTDFDAELRKDKLRALAMSLPGPLLVVVGAILMLIGG